MSELQSVLARTSHRSCRLNLGYGIKKTLGWVRHDLTVLFSNDILLPVCAITNIQLSLYPSGLKDGKSMTVTCGFRLVPCVLSAVCSVLHHNNLSGYVDLCWRVVFVTESPLTEGRWGVLATNEWVWWFCLHEGGQNRGGNVLNPNNNCLSSLYNIQKRFKLNPQYPSSDSSFKKSWGII